MPRLTPDPVEIERLRKSAPAGPVLIVNLLKFKPGPEGRAAYQRYLDASRQVPSAAEVIHSGPAFADVCDGAETWDHVIIARHPTFEAFAATVTHPDWQGSAASHRPEALERTIMLVTSAGPLSP
ncbi:MAG: hypothetical protein JO127_06190 [Caulobacteraceae bacterium]|nr:hypothetical protein [Caulobacteraceae bacterium]